MSVIKRNNIHCIKCGRLTGGKEHICASVDLKKDRKCFFCNKPLQNEGYERYRDHCHYCSSRVATVWEFLRRQLLVKAFGGKCQICGFAEDFCALDFHHINGDDKKTKNFIGQVKKYPWLFALVCSNHHRMITNGKIKCPESLFKKETILEGIIVSRNEINERMFKEYNYDQRTGIGFIQGLHRCS